MKITNGEILNRNSNIGLLNNRNIDPGKKYKKRIRYNDLFLFFNPKVGTVLYILTSIVFFEKLSSQLFSKFFPDPPKAVLIPLINSNLMIKLRL